MKLKLKIDHSFEKGKTSFDISELIPDKFSMIINEKIRNILINYFIHYFPLLTNQIIMQNSVF